jgi:hypothetical protein
MISVKAIFDKRDAPKGSDETHLAIFGQVDLECFRIVLESKRGHGKQDILAIHRLSFLLLTLL